jgi:hypothetical protein
VCARARARAHVCAPLQSKCALRACPDRSTVVYMPDRDVREEFQGRQQEQHDTGDSRPLRDFLSCVGSNEYGLGYESTTLTKFIANDASPTSAPRVWSTCSTAGPIGRGAFVRPSVAFTSMDNVTPRAEVWVLLPISMVRSLCSLLSALCSHVAL